MDEMTYYEVNTLNSPQTSRTLSGDHENRVTDTGGAGREDGGAIS